ncbi:MAG TPA: hypothetical protein VFY93_10775 [Planctomycetota bacterium]|nr:hypothetical protein [Planctomycetota bacterium]
MRKALFWTIALETALLAGGLLLYSMGALEGLERTPPSPPVFRPVISDTRIGDLVRYERRDRATGNVLGYLDYEVRQVIVTEGTTSGPLIVLAIKETDRDGHTRERIRHLQPRALMAGFLPPRFDDEDDYPAGERPVVSRISTATFPLREPPPPAPAAAGSPAPPPPPPPVRGFLVEAVIPRRSLTEVAERYWMTEEVPVFGVARWERGNEVLVLHRMEKPERRG